VANAAPAPGFGTGIRGEKCRWHFARKSSDENLFSIVKFCGQAELAKALVRELNRPQ